MLREYEEAIVESEKKYLKEDHVYFKKGIFEWKIVKMLFNDILAFY